MKLHISTPMYGGQCYGKYTSSMMRLVHETNNIGITLSWEFINNESLISRARENCVHGFLKSDYSHLMFIDADIEFEPYDIIKMLSADKDIICGAYPKKAINWEKVASMVNKGVKPENLPRNSVDWVVNSSREPYIDEKLNAQDETPQEVVYGGTGFMLIKREVFEKLKPHVIEYINNTQYVDEKTYGFFQLCVCPDTGVLLSEDYFFCNKWREIGGKVYLAPWVKLHHIGTYVFG
jgi:hypothetical protein